MSCSVKTHYRYKQYELPAQLLFIMQTKEASMMVRMVLNVKAPCQKYTKTRESSSSVDSDSRDVTELSVVFIWSFNRE